ncbi:MAG: type III pantothenate kinase [Saprospiraceae bacterium]|nr:type III pantothenate kinase [Saprospiraceae bacterium]MBK6564982.1 type III pantothenate kinase [Saprospiraceae bacterium]MBK6783125.1 type III pantothenate kinase [Saprospiraceae bacterium]MBK7523620.1 type III pantothenate kinase [Saprospiraceae bacterium]MBK8079733.1 type III pantothenate kinase [Saprospiraceae bacterium]
MNLVIDVGNSRIKYAIFEDGNIIKSDRLDKEAFASFLEMITTYSIKTVIFSASGKYDDNWISGLRSKYTTIFFDKTTPLPITICYETPESLGRDRIAGCVGAWKHFPGQTSIVIDMGTCITTNIINKNGEYLGGTISPGVQMRAKAMHDFTKNLPLVELELPVEYIGRNTIHSMQNGILRGTYYEVQSFIDNITPLFDVNNVILTGGDAKYFGNLLNFEIFALPNLVLEGLHEILQYNA